MVHVNYKQQVPVTHCHVLGKTVVHGIVVRLILGEAGSTGIIIAYQ